MNFEEFKLELNWFQLTFYSKVMSCHLMCINTFGWDARRSDASFCSLAFKHWIMFSFQRDHHWLVITSEVLSKGKLYSHPQFVSRLLGPSENCPLLLCAAAQIQKDFLWIGAELVSASLSPPFCTSKSFQCFISVTPLLVPRCAFSAPLFSSFAFQKMPPS